MHARGNIFLDGGYENDWRGYYEHEARNGGKSEGAELERHCGNITTVGVDIDENKRHTPVQAESHWVSSEPYLSHLMFKASDIQGFI
jgi:hypothetical protein